MQHGSWEGRREVAALKKQLPQENGDGTSVGGGGLQTDRARSHALNLISCTLTNFYCMWQWLMGERETGREREGVRAATEARHCSKVVTCHFLWPFYCTANFCFRQRQRAVAVCRRWHSMRHRAEEGPELQAEAEVEAWHSGHWEEMSYRRQRQKEMLSRLNAQQLRASEDGVEVVGGLHGGFILADRWG